MKIRNYEKRLERLNGVYDAARIIELNNAGTGIPDAFLSLEETYENGG